jgi:hypothetical protein
MQEVLDRDASRPKLKPWRAPRFLVDDGLSTLALSDAKQLRHFGHLEHLRNWLRGRLLFGPWLSEELTMSLTWLYGSLLHE